MRKLIHTSTSVPRGENMNKAILIAIVLIGTMMVASAGTEYLEIDAEILLPDYIPPEVYTTPMIVVTEPEPLSNLEILQNFLINDTTDHHKYISEGEDMYICTHFATDLAQNGTDRFDTGVVVMSAKYHNKGCGHLLTWIRIDNDLFVIEAGNDDIYWSDDFNKSVDRDIYVVRYESLASGYRKCAEMDKRR